MPNEIRVPLSVGQDIIDSSQHYEPRLKIMGAFFLIYFLLHLRIFCLSKALLDFDLSELKLMQCQLSLINMTDDFCLKNLWQAIKNLNGTLMPFGTFQDID